MCLAGLPTGSSPHFQSLAHTYVVLYCGKQEGLESSEKDRWNRWLKNGLVWFRLASPTLFYMIKISVLGLGPVPPLHMNLQVVNFSRCKRAFHLMSGMSEIAACPSTEDEMAGWHHQLNGHEFGETPGDSEGQGSLVCCSPWSRKVLDLTYWLYNNNCLLLLMILQLYHLPRPPPPLVSQSSCLFAWC